MLSDHPKSGYGTTAVAPSGVTNLQYLLCLWRGSPPVRMIARAVDESHAACTYECRRKKSISKLRCILNVDVCIEKGVKFFINKRRQPT